MFVIYFSAGFLKTGARGSAQGNFGLMDLVAGLHWLRENLPAFGGDPERITLLGHGTGAALANFIAVSPVAKGRVVCTPLFIGFISVERKENLGGGKSKQPSQSPHRDFSRS